MSNGTESHPLSSPPTHQEFVDCPGELRCINTRSTERGAGNTLFMSPDKPWVDSIGMCHIMHDILDLAHMQKVE